MASAGREKAALSSAAAVVNRLRPCRALGWGLFKAWNPRFEPKAVAFWQQSQQLWFFSKKLLQTDLGLANIHPAQ
jgi:hypothetical protein